VKSLERDGKNFDRDQGKFLTRFERDICESGTVIYQRIAVSETLIDAITFENCVIGTPKIFDGRQELTTQKWQRVNIQP